MVDVDYTMVDYTKCVGGRLFVRKNLTDNQALVIERIEHEVGHVTAVLNHRISGVR